MLLHSYQHLLLGIMIVRRSYHFSNIVSNNLFQIYTPDVSSKSSKVGAFLPHPPPFREKNSVSAHQKSRKGTNPIRPNDAIPSFLPIGRSTFVYKDPYSDVLSVQTCKNNHPSFVSKLGWLYGRGRRIRTLNKGFGDPRVTITPCPFGNNMELYTSFPFLSRKNGANFHGFFVGASNIGYSKFEKSSQGKGGDLRSKYSLTLTVVRKKYNGRGDYPKNCVNLQAGVE